MTYTVSKMLVSQACYDEIKDYINDLGPDYQRMKMPDGSIDMTHIALVVGPRPKFMPPRKVPGT